MPACRGTAGVPLTTSGGAKVKSREPAVATKMFEEAAGEGERKPKLGPLRRRSRNCLLTGSDPAKRLFVPYLLDAAVKGVSAPRTTRTSSSRARKSCALELAVSKLLADEAYEAAVKVTETYAVVAPIGREKGNDAGRCWPRGQRPCRRPAGLQTHGGQRGGEYEAFAGLQPVPLVKADLLRRAAGCTTRGGTDESGGCPPDRDPTAGTSPGGLGRVGPTWPTHSSAQPVAGGSLGRRSTRRWPRPVPCPRRFATGSAVHRHTPPNFAQLGRNLFEQIAKQETVRPEERTYHERPWSGWVTSR